MAQSKKLRVDKEYSWELHRGGWRSVVKVIRDNFHNPNGTLFISAIEDRLWYDGAVTEPWVGVVHQVPRHSAHFPDLERLLHMPEWLASMPTCEGLFVLCDYVKQFLRAAGIVVPIAKIPYAQDCAVPRFSLSTYRRERRVLHIGEFLRDFQAFVDLKAPRHRKVLLASPDILTTMTEKAVCLDDSIEINGYASDVEYDSLLSESLVFLNLFDAVATTAILECVVRCTPVLVNRVGALEEYLGTDYPLFYSDLNEATTFLNDDDLIYTATRHLEKRRHDLDLTFDNLINTLRKTTVYSGLPDPSIKESFPTYDITVVICSYARVNHIPVLLQHLVDQDYKGKFEVILWNNERREAATINMIAMRFDHLLTLRVIHSFTNYYCMARFAASSLAKSKLMLFIDDDVTPNQLYISTMVSEYERAKERFGTQVAICCRGHRFERHELPESCPEEVWEVSGRVQFYDETQEATAVHFMHADNLLLSTDLLRESLRYPMPYSEWALIDDYWMSFVLSRYIGCTLWKIQGADLFKFTSSADDQTVAMFHNPAVRHERTRFYVYHMRCGWPFESMKTYKSGELV